MKIRDSQLPKEGFFVFDRCMRKVGLYLKMKTKILLTILPVLIISIVTINLSFGLFFQNFILESEMDKIHVSANSISTYLNELSKNYLGTVNDWAHWDDTYNFIENSSENYVYYNLTASTMQSLNINFMIFINSDDTIMYQVYYNSNEEIISDLPSNILENRDSLIDFSSIGDDTSGILNIGNDYYFIATSHVTDSLEMKNANGILIIGREIDGNIIDQMEKVSGFSISDINKLDNINRLSESDASHIIEIKYDEILSNPVNVEVTIRNNYDLSSSIVLSMIMPRTVFLRGMKQILDFSLFNTFVSLVISLIIFLLVGKFITKPFVSLINDVKSIDVNNPEMHKIPESGKDEFAFLRKSINSLMLKLKSSQAKLIKSREEMYSTLLAIGEGIITVDQSNNIDFINLVAEKMTGWKLEEALNKSLNTVLVIEIKGEPAVDLLSEVLETKEIVKFSNDTRVILKNGNVLDVEITAAPIKDQNGKIIKCVFVINDITEKIKKQRYIEYLSYQDVLTGLYNRSFYEEKLNEFEVKEYAFASLIIIDLDGLKLTNDAFGHETGDRLLIKVAECIKKSVRNDDMVCRIGGDEFVVILSKTESMEIIQIINRIHTVIEKEKIKNMPISISSGWATQQQHGEKMDSVFKRAEDMMYHNKSTAKKSQRHQIIQIIMKTLFEKNPREEAHSNRVSDLCTRIGEYMNLDISGIKNLQTAALLHDIGKIGIDNHCLNKTGPLNKEEWLEIKKHSQIGHNILSSANEYGPLADIVLHHHERWDGNGYPTGLKGEEIPLESRIIALADAYDAMISDRPYRSGMKEAEALLIIENESGKQFDPEIVRIFLEKVIKKS